MNDSLRLIKVYRIENSKGIGPFSPVSFCNFSMRKIQNQLNVTHQYMKTPYFDPKLSSIFNKSYLCAYKSLDDLYKFITIDLMNKLKDNGYMIKELYISDFIEGEDQVIFLKKHLVKEQIIK